MAYSTKIRLKGNSRSRKIYSSRSWQSQRKKLSKRKRLKLMLSHYKRVVYFGCGVVVILILVGVVYGFSYIQSLTERLPSIDKPFGPQPVATEIYDRNGKLLYRVYGNDDRDAVAIKDVPFLVKESFISAEDKNFYEHGGIDFLKIIECGIKSGLSGCGASTIDQQILKLTALNGLNKYERKIDEWIMSAQMDKKYTKDQILQVYLTIVPEGSNIYGVTRAASVYFNKSLNDLTLAQIAVLASIPNNPNNLMPCSQESIDAVKTRQMYVLDQMGNNIDQINARYRQETGKSGDALTKAMIDEAKNETLTYGNCRAKDQMKAPHFVFYVEHLLQQRGYNNGEPFTMEQIETSGMKIYTTLDSDYQDIAEEEVKAGVAAGQKYGAENAALIAMDPRNGEILAMVGSKDYYGANIPAGCSGSNCKFSGAVNITTSLEPYGSSMKPLFYYMGIEKGIITPASIMPDIPIQIGNYKPKNYEGGYNGIATARSMLANSRNIPAIYLVNYLGVDNVVNDLKNTWGYTSFDNPAGFGPAIAIGGWDITLLEHAQAYQVLATEGYFTQNEAILKIVDKSGNTIYNYTPQPKLVADPKAAFIVNDILNEKNGGPGVSKMHRDAAGKTGTSDSNQDTLFVNYTPEIVVVGWLGNNNNADLKLNGQIANGSNSAKPWIADFYYRIEPKLQGLPFVKPAGVIKSGNCSAADGTTCDNAGSDYSIAGINAPDYMKTATAVVCTDEPDKLARPIDIALGLSQTITVKEYSMIDPSLQKYLDSYIPGWYTTNVVKNPALAVWGPLMPTQQCDINRNPGGNTQPWAVINSPTASGSYGNMLPLSINGYSQNGDVTGMEVRMDGNPLKSYSTVTISDSLDIGSLSNGSHTLSVDVTDSTGTVGTTSATFEKVNPTATPTPTTAPTHTPTPTVEVTVPVATH